MIKAIAFDFTEVLFTRADEKIASPLQWQIVEGFGFHNPDAEFLAYFARQLGMSEREVEKETRKIIASIYPLKEPDLFEKIPPLKFAAATNHLSYMIDYFFGLPISENFIAAVSSGEVGFTKPQAEFYRIVAERLEEPPAKILFVDDTYRNIRGATEFGMQVLHHQPDRLLSEEINSRLQELGWTPR